MAREDIPLDSSLTKPVGRGKKRGRKKEKEREEEGRERNSTFSLVFPAIGPSVTVRARRKVLPRENSFE